MQTKRVSGAVAFAMRAELLFNSGRHANHPAISIKLLGRHAVNKFLANAERASRLSARYSLKFC